jgi:hypothetical protein
VITIIFFLSYVNLRRFTFQPFYLPGKDPQYPLNRTLSEPHSLSKYYGEERNSLSYWELNPDSSADQHVKNLNGLIIRWVKIVFQ